MSYASVYEQTHSRQCCICNLFISWLWTQPVIVLPMARACDDQSTVHLDWQLLPVLRACAMFEGLTEFCFVLRFGFRASLLHFTSQIERLHFSYHCAAADVWSVLGCFCSEYSPACPSTGRPCQVRSSTACVCRSFRDECGRSAVRAQPWLFSAC